jgi:Recombinase/Resolvase, N terminal domain
MKYCFSLARYSSETQRGNSSITTQVDAAKAVASRNGWTYREDWSIKQEAISAFKKHNFPQLWVLIDDVKNGRIPEGTVCVVFAIDRLTRASLDEGREMIRQMLLAGLEICDRDGDHYTKADLNDLPKLLTLCLKIMAANQYSKNLSDRIKGARRDNNTAILNGVVLTKTKKGYDRKNYANWISCVNGKFELNGNAQVVRSIFQMYLSGTGPGAITRYLNQNKVVTFSGRGMWGQGQVYKLLQNRQVIGEYTANGETVKGYFPLVVTEEVFLKVQSKMNDNRGKKPTGNLDGENIYNIFAGVAECVCCGKKIKLMKQGRYMTCYGAIGGICKQTMITAGQFESSFASLLRLKADELVQDESGNTVNANVQILNGQLVEIQKQIANAEKTVEYATLNAMFDLLPKVQTTLNGLKTQETETKRKLELESAKKVSVKGGSDRLNKILERLDTLKTDTEMRKMVQTWIRENINRVTVNRSEKTYSVDFKNGQYITMNMDGTVIACKSFIELFGKNTENLAETYQQQTFGKANQ